MAITRFSSSRYSAKRLDSYSIGVGIQEVVTGNFARFKWTLWPPSTIRIVDWNIDRGQRLPAIIDFLSASNSDILILQEADLNARRTQRLNIAEEIARKLEMNYVFGREFQELVQGSAASRFMSTQARTPSARSRS